MLRSFILNRSGNFAILSALMLIPMILAVGFAIDGARYYKARAHLQDAVDLAALAVAASDEQDIDKLQAQASDFIRSNLAVNTISSVELASFSGDDEEITIGVSGVVETTFMKIANFNTMPLQAETVAKRAPEQTVEVALVLDNTYSMIATDPKTGETRIATLRRAAKGLVEALMPDPKPEEGTVSLALVPYADHVNVGAHNKTQPWLALNGEERTETGGGNRVCTEKVKTGTESYCKKWPKKTCTRTRDGVVESYSCDDTSQTCLEKGTRDVYEQKCTGSDPWKKTFSFYGCVGTRTSGSLRLNDTSPTVKYPAYVEQSLQCARPIIPLSKDRAALLAGVAAMTHQPSSYVANTHIPSGIVWGQNVLSPAAPFTEAGAYDPENTSPRKIMILMTDGDNTLIHNSSGKHVAFDSKTAASQFASVNKDTVDACAYVKSQKIEIYSIAFMVTKPEAKEVLRQCATSDAYYYDASDAARLMSAFSGIARAINQVRLAR